MIYCLDVATSPDGDGDGVGDFVGLIDRSTTAAGWASTRCGCCRSARDRYTWRETSTGDLPDNWRAAFGGPAWTWDDATGRPPTRPTGCSGTGGASGTTCAGSWPTVGGDGDWSVEVSSTGSAAGRWSGTLGPEQAVLLRPAAS